MSVSQGQEQGQQQHFFSEAPVIRWASWFWRRFWGSPSQPRRVPLDELRSEKIQKPPGIQLGLAGQKSAAEYSKFLRSFFSEVRASIVLDVPAAILAEGFSSGALIGVEARHGQKLIGFVVSSYGGKYLNTGVSMITWLCVHPDWRKRGITNMLLRTILKIAPKRDIHIWRNDGWLRSPIPPTFSDTRIQRRRQAVRTTVGGQPANTVQKESLSAWRSNIRESWTKMNPDGLFFDDAGHMPLQIEVWTRSISKETVVAVCLQPTYEINATTGEKWCEVIAWAVRGRPLDTYSLSIAIESILDKQPYEWIDAPQMMPHLELGWSVGGSTSWSLLGLDPGIPVLRPMCSLCAY